MYRDLLSYDRQRDGYAKWFAANMAAGGLGGASALVFVYPLDFARTRLANDVAKMNHRQYSGIVDVFRQTMGTDGILTFVLAFSNLLGTSSFILLIFIRLGGFVQGLLDILCWHCSLSSAVLWPVRLYEARCTREWTGQLVHSRLFPRLRRNQRCGPG